MTKRWPTVVRVATGIAIAASLTAVGAARAEPESGAAPTIEVGSRVRLEAPTLARKRLEGTVIGLGEKALVVRRNGLEPLSVPREAITRLDVRTGQRRWTLRGALVGAGAGLVAVGLTCGGGDGGCGQAAPVVTYAALAGAGIGALIKSDRWQAVPLDRVRITHTPAPRGVGLAVSIGF
jgi:hypothetical protein